MTSSAILFRIAFLAAAIGLVILWWVDNRRGAHFDPVTISSCSGSDCSGVDPALLNAFRQTSSADFRPWAPIDFCHASIGILSSTDENDVLRLIPLQLERDGIIAIDQANGMMVISPASRIRGAYAPFRQWLPGARKASCHQSAYGPALPAMVLLLLWFSIRPRSCSLVPSR